MSAVIIAATDGSCIPNPGPGGWAWYVDPGCYAYGWADQTTNNAMELEAIRQVLTMTTGSIRIIADSSYSIDCVTLWYKKWQKNGWRTGRQPVKNAELIRSILLLAQDREVKFERVRGHSGHPLNEAADRLAVHANVTRSTRAC